MINANLFSNILAKVDSFCGVVKSFLRLNFIAFRINKEYKLNIYLLLFIFICVLCSIIIRTNIINDILLLYFDHYYVNIIMNILSIFAIIFCLRLIFGIVKRCLQAFGIIPKFISLYKTKSDNVKTIISLYYLQNIFFILLSL